MASIDGKCPVCLGDHMIVSPSGETRVGSRLTNCTDGFMKTAKERSKIVKEVKGCHFCSNLRHTSEQCRMQHKFTRTKQTEVLSAERSTTVVYTGQSLGTASQCLSTYNKNKQLQG